MGEVNGMNKKQSNSQLEEVVAEQPVEELFLLHLRYKEAQMVEAGSNRPILLKDKDTAWVVYAGRVDLFAVQLVDGRINGPRQHLFRVEAGGAVLGVDMEAVDGQMSLLVVGNKDTSLLKLPTSRLQALSRDEEFGPSVIALLERWVAQLSGCLALTLPPKNCLNLEAGQETAVTSETYASVKRGILWVEHLQGKSYFMGKPQFAVNGKGYTPLSAHTWIETVEESQIRAQNTAVFLQHDPSWTALHNFHRLALQYILHAAQQVAQTDLQRLQSRITFNEETINEALTNLAAPLTMSGSQPRSGVGQKPMLKACRLVAERLGISLVEPPAHLLNNAHLNPLAEIAKASQFQWRRVVLKGVWWTKDSGPLLGYWEESNQPVAILPRTARSYVVHDPVTGSQTAVNEAVAEKLAPFAAMFYRPFASRAVAAVDILRFGFYGRGRELRTIAFVGATVSLLSLVTPVAIGLVFNTIIPNAALGQLWQLALVMLVIALATAMFQITQNIAVLRLQGKMGNEVQAAVWNRLVSLPVSFFRDYTAGDLGNRAMGINAIQQTLSGPVMYALLSGVFSLFSFFLLYYYSKQLALVATALVFIAVAVTVFSGYKQVQYQRILTDLQGRISGAVLQAITGIAKFRTSASEGKAFAMWANEFSQMKATTYKSRELANSLVVFNVGFTVVAAMIIFAVVAAMGQEGLSTGNFLAFNAAFAQFLASVLVLSATLVRSLGVVPSLERARPILQTEPEINEFKEYPGELSGQIEVSHVSFRYREGSPLVLNDVSLMVNAGEFVALVGPSGSGKSTLFRLLIGFEEPEMGSIYYDGQELAQLNIREVRRQIGVVLQNGKIMAGDLFTNIVGASTLALDDAWEAARMAGLAEDIEAMPMGMHTIISDGGGTLSGGQRQRLLIAHALVNRPRIIFFDEATSALDNRTQAVVSESLDNLKATRIVIAHRLSTIMNADKIYVMQNGRVVQQGTYEELIKSEGVFADLAKRQLA
jgi:NHLM bacteriocin system ABC transporter ATP-binding protein